ncbi:hypothetical protein MKEN_00292600 [Mycena kentingensis (nom. inval.)]|nr:hypothetical protein MKEN_00292600 [Mycena kentingensis (nom. inval.)]
MASTSRAEDHSKMKRLPGSCDRCWRKKVRCDRATMGGGTCSNCAVVRAECTHTRRKGAKHRSKTSIQGMKVAKEQVARILSSSNYFAPTDPDEVSGTILELAEYARALEQQVASLQEQVLRYTNGLSMSSNASATASSPARSEEEVPAPKLSMGRNNEERSRPRTAISWQFLQTAVQHVPEGPRTLLHTPWKRPEVWKRQPWELFIPESWQRPQYTFPEDDLLTSLVALFFAKVNPILACLFHQPSFRAAVFVDRLHLRDAHFGAVVLVVCALGAQHSQDPRVLLEGTTDGASCGWKWFGQIRTMPAVVVSENPGTLYQLQRVVLSVAFLTGTAMATRDETWVLAGFGLRLAEAAGVHRRTNAYSRFTSLESEQYRRVVWFLVVFESLLSSFQGRKGYASSMQIDQLDIPPLSDADEEYWETEDAGSLQPVGRPSASAFFLAYIELVKIIWGIHTTVYPGGGKVTDKEAVIALDSALNRWVETIPDHLRWNANLEDSLFLDQSAALYASYYHAQIILHRVFIPLPNKERHTSLPFPSMAICANAARSVAHVLTAQTQKGTGLLHLPSLTTIVFDSAIVLFVNILANGRARKLKMQKPQPQEDFGRVTADVQMCLRLMRGYETRWRLAARRCDAIVVGLRLVKLALFSPGEAESASDAALASAPTSNSTTQSTATTPTSARSGFASESGSASSSQSSSPLYPDASRMYQQSHSLHGLPLRSDDLGAYGAVPVHAEWSYPELEPAFDPSPNPNQQWDADAMDLDLEAMFGAAFTSDQLMGGTGEQAFQQAGQWLQAPPDAWNMFSAHYTYGDWNTYGNGQNTR